jgi:hypothetical protein
MIVSSFGSVPQSVFPYQRKWRPFRWMSEADIRNHAGHREPQRFGVANVAMSLQLIERPCDENDRRC